MKRILINLILIHSLYGFYPAYHGQDAAESLRLWGVSGQRFIQEDYIKYFPYYQHYTEQTQRINVKNINLAKLPPPYNQVKKLTPFNGSGCYFNSQYVQKLFELNTITTALEIGSDLGLSTRHIASLLPDNAVLYAVDVWDNNTNENYTNNRFIPFLSNVIHCGLWNKIIPVKQTSQKALATFATQNKKFDFIYIDGDHATQAVLRDLKLSYPLLAVHGIIAGDDWLLKTVRAAVVEFAQTNNLTIYGTGNFWCLKNENQYQFKEFLEAQSYELVF